VQYELTMRLRGVMQEHWNVF